MPSAATPILYLRVGGAPTLSHYANGDYYYSGFSMSANSPPNVGSEYGNWVPLSGPRRNSAPAQASGTLP